MSEYNLHPESQLTALKGVMNELDLAGAAGALAERLDQAKAAAWSPEQLLARLLADEVAHRERAQTPKRLTIGDSARWFQVDGQSSVSLVRRTALRRLLSAVLTRRADGIAASVQDMAQAGWPRETLTATQAATRVYTAIRTLRRMGLDKILITTDRGYEIAPEVDVVRQPS